MELTRGSTVGIVLVRSMHLKVDECLEKTATQAGCADAVHEVENEVRRTIHWWFITSSGVTA